MRVLFNIERLINPTPQEKAELEKVLHVRTIKKNAFFLQEGHVCKSIAFIEKGSVRYFYQLEDREVCKDFVFENGLIGSFASFFSQQPATLNIQAMEETQLIELNYPDVIYLYDHVPAWQKLGRIIAQDQFVRAEKREAALLKDLPEVRFRALIEEHPKIFKRVPLQYIASYLGITRETLSRYRNKVKNDK
ncbi:Crp/Fnr family transcriptional regulator [Dyadobacter luticola]|uniref:Crp/Fnr family transcriptional regulator n=1 Tax=Dyadobacter luticola TaxID=1979387 RepID=A0A5R9KZF1_9BACT|nr:Crp/Fnr family transcriptional regulator [Dyadobacter luticola]TLV01469.1 Crp/Fnr family transcriptional regulator [Dyadobacter luticola]